MWSLDRCFCPMFLFIAVLAPCVLATSWDQIGCHKTGIRVKKNCSYIFGFHDIAASATDQMGLVLHRSKNPFGRWVEIGRTEASEKHSSFPWNSTQPGILFRGTRKISIPGCVEFQVTTNACRGFCPSYSTPSPEWILRSNARQSIWSVGQCCNIMETEDLFVEVMCVGGMKKLVFKSARTCSCYHCKKE
ncbi:Thyrostimulin alpha-2 subunit like protein [Argiope bruennichi]|uniref:Thyrostimulin alpha-2 subunit like protein n=1 Tax=Argiope bruennichi TaxID=94029 RepID=A0A8T0ET84_ARGBR|nr:Thyrostimulin alpha-2 subunit like protein [Argiope bruennichi]